MIDALHMIHTESFQLQHHSMVIKITNKREDFIKITGKRGEVYQHFRKRGEAFKITEKGEDFIKISVKEHFCEMDACCHVWLFFESFGHPAEWPLVSWSLKLKLIEKDEFDYLEASI